MGHTRDRLDQIIGPAIEGDPNLLKVQVLGEESLTPAETFESVWRQLTALMEVVLLLADEIDDLRSAFNGRPTEQC